MEEKNIKNEIVKTMTDVEYYPTVLNNEEVNIERYTKLPFASISAIGTAFEPLTAAFQKFVLGNSGTSGIYRVNTKGRQLAQFQDGSGYLGGLLTECGAVGGGQAILNPLLCSPTMLFMAAALMSITQKLDSIHETQIEIIEFLEQQEKSKLRGNFNFLTDVLNNYKHNWTNEKYINSNHIKVLDIKQDSEQSILFYREQIAKQLTKKLFLHSDKSVKGILTEIQAELREYQLALYLYAYSSFLEVMLLENFEQAYLDGIARKIEDYALQYNALYTDCYTHIETHSKSSVQSYLLSGLGAINKIAGNAVSKIPGVRETRIDGALFESSFRLDVNNSRRTAQTLEQLTSVQGSAVHPFIENIKAVNKLYNQPIELLFDEENIYFSLPDN